MIPFSLRVLNLKLAFEQAVKLTLISVRKPAFNTTKLCAALPCAWLLMSCSAEPSTHSKTKHSTDTNQYRTAQTQVLRIAAAANLASVLPTIIDTYTATYNDNNADNSADNDNEPNVRKNTAVNHDVPEIEVTYASSGKLYAQINSGAPYDIFLSANQAFPAKYAEQKIAAAPKHQPFTYARGQLALYSTSQSLDAIKANANNPNISSTNATNPNATNAIDKTTLHRLFTTQPVSAKHAIKISIANPELAPYGASAKAFLEDQGLYKTLLQNNQLIQAENIGQTFQYTHTGITDYGFVALSQLISTQVNPAQYLTLAPNSYPPILQDGIVISSNPKADDFANYLQSQAAQQQFADAGYLSLHAAENNTVQQGK